MALHQRRTEREKKRENTTRTYLLANYNNAQRERNLQAPGYFGSGYDKTE